MRSRRRSRYTPRPRPPRQPPSGSVRSSREISEACGSHSRSSLIRGASPLGLPDTLSRSPLRRLAPFAWLARDARSHNAVSCESHSTGRISQLTIVLPADPAVRSEAMLHHRLGFRCGYCCVFMVLVVSLPPSSARAADPRRGPPGSRRIARRLARGGRQDHHRHGRRQGVSSNPRRVSAAIG